MRTPKICSKPALVALILLVGLSGSALAEPSCKPGPDKQENQADKADPEGQANDEALQKVLARMDASARTFHSVQANFVWKMYNSVINDIAECDTGKIYFQRTRDGIEMAADIAQPAPKQVIFSQGKIQVYNLNPGMKQIDVYNASAHREEFEAFLVLGFGSSGDEMRKSFNVKYVGPEKVENVASDRLELTPISPSVQKQFSRIDLWIDAEGFSIRQKLFQPDGDYRLAEYFNIDPNKKIPAKVFNLKPPAGTKIVNH